MNDSIIRRLKLNTFTSLSLQTVAIISGFIIPRLIIKTYGSTVNGLLSSITQFLGIIAFLELGIGAVVQSALYEPLASKNQRIINEIVSSANIFFQRLAKILLIYVMVLAVVFPLMSKDFSWEYTVFLIVVMSVNTFCQYYYGIVDKLVLNASQHGYIHYSTQIVTMVANIIVAVVVVKLGGSIQVLKFCTAIIYLFQPILIRKYVNSKYSIDRKAKFTGEPIKQKWNGVSQHIAAVVLSNTDVIVLTLFTSFNDVSIYSVYAMILNGIKSVFISMTSGVQALVGDMWAQKKNKEIERIFNWTEWLIHTGTVLIFGCTSGIIIQFVAVYTRGVVDVDYNRYLFAMILVVATASYCLRLPYNIIILAAGHYKQTQNNYILAAGMNLVISVLLVNKWGLEGVAVGTLFAMFYQTVWMANYDNKNLVNKSMAKFWKQMATNALSVICGVFFTHFVKLNVNSYLSWIGLALLHLMIWVIVVLLINLIFYRDNVSTLKNRIIHKFEGKIKGKMHENN